MINFQFLEYMFSLNKHLKLHALRSHTVFSPYALPRNLWRLKVWQWEQTFSQKISYPSSFHLNLTSSKMAFGAFISECLPAVLVGVWKYKKKLIVCKEIFNMIEFEVCRKTWSHFSFVVYCFISVLESFLFNGYPFVMKIHPTLYPQEQPLEGLMPLFLICSFHFSINACWAAVLF